jgi:predicted RecB family nuclease
LSSAERASAASSFGSDLLAWFLQTFQVRGEASIKAVAQFFGFTWAVGDPGGRLSQAKIEIARGAGREALDARRWCLDYNASDVAAQAAIRDGILEICSSNEIGYA